LLLFVFVVLLAGPCPCPCSCPCHCLCLVLTLFLSPFPLHVIAPALVLVIVFVTFKLLFSLYLQYLADVEEHLGETIPVVGSDLKVEANEFDGKVVYGEKRGKGL